MIEEIVPEECGHATGAGPRCPSTIMALSDPVLRLRPQREFDARCLRRPGGFGYSVQSGFPSMALIVSALSEKSSLVKV